MIFDESIKTLTVNSITIQRQNGKNKYLIRLYLIKMPQLSKP